MSGHMWCEHEKETVKMETIDILPNDLCPVSIVQC